MSRSQISDSSDKSGPKEHISISTRN